MSIVKAQIVRKNGKKEFAILAYKDCVKLREEVEDYEDLRCLRAATLAEGSAPTLGLAEVQRKLKGRTRRSSG